MNKRLIVVMLLVMLLLSACKKDKNKSEITPETTQPVGTTEAVEETHFVAENVLKEEDFENSEEIKGIQNEENSNVIEATEPVKEDAPVETVEPTEATEPAEETEPVVDTTDPTEEQEKQDVGIAVNTTDYEKYHNMSGAEQKNFVDSFSSIEAFFAWYNSAKAEYDALHPEVGVGDLEIDLGGVGG